MAYYNKTLFEQRSMLIGIVHGAIEPCNSNEYPSIYTRVNSPENLKWVMKEVFGEDVETFDPRGGPTGDFFTCAQGAQISADLKCDGNNNCGDYSDEFGCPRTDPVCTTKITKDKPQSKECVLPFRYDDKLYYGCPPDPDVAGEYWCSTKVDREGNHKLGNYGLCNTACPKE